MPYFSFRFLLKTQDYQKIPVLAGIVLFLYSMVHVGQKCAHEILAAFILFIPFLLFLQQIHYSVQRDYHIGFIDQWVAMKKTRLSYLFYKTIVSMVTLLLPFMLVVSFFIKDFTISHFFGFQACLFFGGLTTILLGVSLGLFHLNIPQMIIFILPINVPNLLLTLSAFKTQQFMFPMLISLAVLCISGGLISMMIDQSE